MPPVRKAKAQITTKKPLVEKNKRNGSDNDEGAISDIKDAEIAKLLDEIHKLKIENEMLRKNIDEKNSIQNPIITNPRRVSFTEVKTPVKGRLNSTQSMKTKERGCSCTGSCANKKCGCVKKDSSCSEFCKCSDNCQNQIADINEDKENVNEQNKSKAKTVKKTNSSKQQVTQNQSSNSSSESEPNSPTTDTDKGAGNSSYSSNTSSQIDDNDGGASPNSPKPKVNPMKPTRQLPRSPLQKPELSPELTVNMTANTTIFNDDDVFLPVPKIEAEDELPPPDEIHQMEVDWVKHQANLVHCRKCKRTFHAYRIKKHEQSCKKI